MRLQVKEEEVSFVRGSGDRGWYIHDRWNPFDSDVAVAVVQPVRRYNTVADIDKSSTGNHWILLVFVNWRTVKFNRRGSQKVRAGSARVFQMDSLADVTNEDELLLMKEAFLEFIAQAAVQQQDIEIDVARTVVASVPWVQVGCLSALSTPD